MWTLVLTRPHLVWLCSIHSFAISIWLPGLVTFLRLFSWRMQGYGFSLKYKLQFRYVLQRKQDEARWLHPPREPGFLVQRADFRRKTTVQGSWQIRFPAMNWFSHMSYSCGLHLWNGIKSGKYGFNSREGDSKWAINKKSSDSSYSHPSFVVSSMKRVPWMCSTLLLFTEYPTWRILQWFYSCFMSHDG